MRGNKGVFFPSDPAESAYTQVLAFAMAAGKLLEEDKKINRFFLARGGAGHRD